MTLAFGEIIGRAAINGDEGVFGIGSFNLTNGKIGIQPVDRPDLPFLDQFTTLDLRPWYYLALALALLVIFINLRLRDSRLGRAWIAVREDEVAAVSMGIPTVKVKLLAYAIGAAMGGVAGAFLGAFIERHQRRPVPVLVLDLHARDDHPRRPRLDLGRDPRRVTLSLHQHAADPRRAQPVAERPRLDFDLTQLSFGIFGFLLVIMMVLRPQGLMPERRREMELTEGIDDDPLVEVKA